MKYQLTVDLAAGGRLGLSLCCGMALLLFAQASPASAQQTLEPTQDPLSGSAVFQAKGCVKCHAVEGLGGSMAPDLARIPRRRSFHELAAGLWNHVPVMGDEMRRYDIERPEMDAHEAADLIGFLFTLDYFDEPGDVDRGRRLFIDKKCAVCHRIDVFGGEIGPNLDFVGQFGSPILVAAKMWNHSAAMADSMKARGIVRPTFQGTELIDLIAYIGSVVPEPLEGRVYALPGRAEAGRVVFVDKRCNECHSVQGVGGRVGPDLADRGRQWSLTEFAAAMWNKMPVMTKALEDRGLSFPQIGGVEMADLVAYLYSVGYFAELGDAELAPERMRTAGCLSCHALKGSGGASAGDLSAAGPMESPAAVIAVLWNHAFFMRSGSDAEGRAWPRLKPEEMADIMAYLQMAPDER